MTEDSPLNNSPSYQKWAVVMAGGIGERFWPLSTPGRPKQLLPLGIGGNTLLKDALERILPVVPRENIWLATSADLRDVFSSLHLLPEEQIIVEPSRKNTAGCLSYIVAHLLAKYEERARDIVMAVMTADQRIEPVDDFVRTVGCMMDCVSKKQVLGIIGIPPTRAETGFGYIEAGDVVYCNEGIDIYTVKKFHEKPNEQVAGEYISAGNYYWNSGMFFWKVETFLDEIKQASPLHWNAIIQMSEQLKIGNWNSVNSIFQSLPDISIDYALMERTTHVVMVKGNFYWDDLGSWTSLDRILPHNENGNILQGDVTALKTKNTIIYNEGSLPLTVVSFGVENMVIAVSHNTVLVMDKKEAPNMKQVLEKVKKHRQGKRISDA